MKRDTVDLLGWRPANRSLPDTGFARTTTAPVPSAQHSLPLAGGFHVGPLFETRIKRTLVRPKGKAGIVHRAQTKRATPPWADMVAIKAIYAEARRLTRETGELHVVDHIIPKCGALVCGLHVPNNLQILHWLPNARKGAWQWPGMPFEQIELL